VKRKNVKEMAIGLLAEQGRVTSGDLARVAGVSRQSAHATLAALVSAGNATPVGAGRGAHYVPADALSFNWQTAGLEEHLVWEELRAQHSVSGLSANAEAVLGYSVSEMVNNVIDHSGSDILVTRVSRDSDDVVVVVEDVGIGVFERIRMAKNLPDALSALEQLSKGKLTTDPEHHTGEGIFFTSKMVDRFTIRANGIEWTVDNAVSDFAVGVSGQIVGSQVVLRHAADSDTRIEDVFGEYTTDFSFDTTQVVVRLFERGEVFVSRSEARRIATGLDVFARVIVDFRGVLRVGQGFVDELFRVWASQHPSTRLEPVVMNEAVSFMVRRASQG
jgi:anti-sigma regulatory factor (Ser/Thr protein kinase)